VYNQLEISACGNTIPDERHDDRDDDQTC